MGPIAFFDMRGRVLNIGFITTEAAPFVKVGGLADVCTGLAKALQQAGLSVHLVIPYYRRLMHAMPWRRRSDGVYETTHQGVTLWALRHDAYFDREYVYAQPFGDYPDNCERFSWFCRRALDVLQQHWTVDVLHVHDWPTALIPVYTKTHPHYRRHWSRTPVVLTIHNLSHQGIFPHEAFGVLDLPPSLWSIDGLEYYGRINCLKGGLLFADHITTVSPTYAREILTPQYGCGLEGVLQKRQKDLSGILNGIDEDEFNPQTDAALWQRYSIDHLERRRENKRRLMAQYEWPQDESVILGAFIGRLSEQKGVDVLMAALPTMLDRHDTRFVVLGEGEARYREGLTRLIERVGDDRLRVVLGFDETFARRCYAACDLFVMPSVFEPCGLGQMIAMRYGALPLVHKTGGLADTVRDVSAQGWGFVFEPLNAACLVKTWGRAVAFCLETNQRIKAQVKAMQQDHSWRHRSKEYIALYQRLVR